MNVIENLKVNLIAQVENVKGLDLKKRCHEFKNGGKQTGIYFNHQRG